MNFNLAGSGTLAGGEYEKVSLSGSSKLDGEVRCASMRCSGSFGGKGSIDCAGDMRLSGAAHVDGPIAAHSLTTAGALKCASVRGESLHLAGAVKVEGDIEAEIFELRGSLSSGGLVNADKIDFVIDSVSRVQSMGGSEISIVPSAAKKGVIGRLFKCGSHGELRVAESIEGDEIALENVVCPRVVGRRVSVGPGCSIGLLQYSEEAEVSPAATVERQLRV